MALVAIDPDTTLFGWARFGLWGLLEACDVAVTPFLPTFDGPVEYVCEVPEDRPGSNARKNDIIALALAAGRIVGTRPCTFRKPSDWKGQLPKKVHHQRMRGVMFGDEIKTLDTALANTIKGSHPEILDAVALGLTHLGRL